MSDNTKRVNLDFDLDDPLEKATYEFLQKKKGKQKRYVVSTVLSYEGVLNLGGQQQVAPPPVVAQVVPQPTPPPVAPPPLHQVPTYEQPKQIPVKVKIAGAESLYE